MVFLRTTAHEPVHLLTTHFQNTYKKIRCTNFLISLASAQEAKKEKPVKKAKVQGKIVGGSPGTISQFAYQVSLLTEGKHFCGGCKYN